MLSGRNRGLSLAGEHRIQKSNLVFLIFWIMALIGIRNRSYGSGQTLQSQQNGVQAETKLVKF